MQDEIKFDFVKAQNLIATLEDCRNKLTTVAKEIKSAAPTGGWWEGPSQEGYMSRFTEAFPNLDEYGLIINDVLNYLKKVSSEKSDFEKRGKNRFK